LRAQPSTDADVVITVQAGTNVEVLEHDPAGWSRVQVGNSTGYIRSDYLRIQTGDTAVTFRTTAGVNLRSSESTDSNVLRTVAPETNVEMLEHNPAGWSRVRVSGTTGYIRSDYLMLSSSGSGSASAAPPEQTVTTLRTTGTVNLRSGPSTADSIIKTLALGTSVEVIEAQPNGWSSVRQNGTNGFIRSDLLTDGAPPSQATATLRTIGAVNLRSGPSTSNSIIRTLTANTVIDLVEQQANGWSRVRHNGTVGFIRSDLLTNSEVASSASPEESIAVLRTVTGVNFRSGPSTNDEIIRLLHANTPVEVLENQANGWSRVRQSGTDGYIRSDLLASRTGNVELQDWSEARNIIQTGVNLSIVDVRTGISFNLRSVAKSGHVDVEPPTQTDTDAIFRTRNGVWSWAPRPVWVTVNGRTLAGALNGMPHDVSTIRDNGMNGHLCLHFDGTVTNSQSYQADLRNVVLEAFNARPQ